MNKKIKLISLISTPILLGGGFASLSLVNQCGGNSKHFNINTIDFLTYLGSIPLYAHNEDYAKSKIANSFLNVNAFVIEHRCSGFGFRDFEVKNIKLKSGDTSTAEIHGIGRGKGEITIEFTNSPSDDVQNSGYFLYGDIGDQSSFDPTTAPEITCDTLRNDESPYRELVINPGRLTYWDDVSHAYVLLPYDNYEFDFSSSDDTIAQIVRTDDETSDKGTYQIVTCENTGIVYLYTTIIGLNMNDQRVILWQGTSCVNVTKVEKTHFYHDLNLGALNKIPPNYKTNYFRDFRLIRNGLKVADVIGLSVGGGYTDKESSHFELQQSFMHAKPDGDWSKPIDETIENVNVGFFYTTKVNVVYNYGLNNSNRLSAKFSGVSGYDVYFIANVHFSYSLALFFKNVQQNYDISSADETSSTAIQNIITGYSNDDVTDVVFSATCGNGDPLPSQLTLNSSTGVITINKSTNFECDNIIITASKDGFESAVSDPFYIHVNN